MKEITVTKIVDGDTLIIEDEGTPHYARIINVDAPEIGQEQGKACKQWLEEIVLHKQRVVRILGKDKYNRLLIHWNEGALGIDELLVSIGHAWEFTKYNKNKSLEGLQNDAIKIRMGIWSDPAPVPPWIWRKMKRAAKLRTSK